MIKIGEDEVRRRRLRQGSPGREPGGLEGRRASRGPSRRWGWCPIRSPTASVRGGSRAVENGRVRVHTRKRGRQGVRREVSAQVRGSRSLGVTSSRAGASRSSWKVRNLGVDRRGTGSRKVQGGVAGSSGAGSGAAAGSQFRRLGPVTALRGPAEVVGRAGGEAEGSRSARGVSDGQSVGRDRAEAVSGDPGVARPSSRSRAGSLGVRVGRGVRSGRSAQGTGRDPVGGASSEPGRRARGDLQGLVSTGSLGRSCTAVGGGGDVPLEAWGSSSFPWGCRRKRNDECFARRRGHLVGIEGTRSLGPGYVPRVLERGRTRFGKGVRKRGGPGGLRGVGVGSLNHGLRVSLT